MAGKAYMFGALLIAAMLFTLVAAEAQNYTVGIIRIYNSEDSFGLEDINFSASCNGQDYDKVTEVDGIIYVRFLANDCDSDSGINIHASRGTYSGSESLDVEKCVTDDSSDEYGYCSSITSENSVLNYAYGAMKLNAPSPSSRHHQSLRINITGVAVTSSNITVNQSNNLNDSTITFEDNDVSNDTIIEDQNENAGGSITGAVIGTLRANAGIVALAFIAFVLVAYMFVLKKRRSYY